MNDSDGMILSINLPPAAKARKLKDPPMVQITGITVRQVKEFLAYMQAQIEEMETSDDDTWDE